MQKDKLLKLRKRINKIDEKLIKTLSQRMDAVKQIGEFKRAHKIKSLDMKRWNEVMKFVMNRSRKFGLSQKLIILFYNLIHKYSLGIENGSVKIKSKTKSQN